MTDVGVIRVWMVGAVLYVLSLILAGISNQYQSVWGFWLSVGVLSGFATGFTNLPAAVGIVKWFREVGRPGLGSGIAGFCFGMWPAIFSFYCPILIKNYGVTKSFYYNALIVTISSIPAMMFLADPSEVPLMAQPEDISSSSNDFVTQEQPEEGNRRENNTTLQSSQAYPMKLQEILTTKQFSIQFLAICFSLLPGFAMKFNISVFASAIFHADASTQAIISFIYLFSYSLIRLVVGLLAGSNPAFSSSHIASFSALIQVPGFIAAGLVVWFGSQYLWAFVVFQTIVGMGLAAYKVTVSLNALARWGLQNFSTMFSLLFLAFGLAGTIGPFFGWIALSYQGDVPLKTLKADEVLDDHKQATEQTMSIFLYVMGGISMLGFVLNVFFCKNVVSNNENV
jgi:OFA family oxalate/formate antiporter-like MFS transporter